MSKTWQIPVNNTILYPRGLPPLDNPALAFAGKYMRSAVATKVPHESLTLLDGVKADLCLR